MNEAFVVSRAQAREHHFEKSIMLPYALHGDEIDRYTVVEPSALLIESLPSASGRISKTYRSSLELKAEFPHIYEHLLSFKNRLRQRQDSRRSYAAGADWYRHLRAGSFSVINPKKLVLKGIAKQTCVGLLHENTAFDGARCPAIVPEHLDGYHQNYLLGILNV